MKKILVIGSLNADMVVRVPHIPVAGETILAETADMSKPSIRGWFIRCANGYVRSSRCRPLC